MSSVKQLVSSSARDVPRRATKDLYHEVKTMKTEVRILHQQLWCSTRARLVLGALVTQWAAQAVGDRSKRMPRSSSHDTPVMAVSPYFVAPKFEEMLQAAGDFVRFVDDHAELPQATRATAESEDVLIEEISADPITDQGIYLVTVAIPDR
ncbi:unnamed protein product [Prorocentrum cordatum]|uniref:Uncharacterized protein n=1 Tax=Prorocentrum cordatum TaxID=2364126 RepID=A0ABN9PRQ8_9DINO|nr:unnamed protein product [Polarella glacialis]